jgi:pimeloyl-ACP methyl ester carboxylesterase
MIDNPGSGKSECPPLPLRLATVADMIVEALDELGIGCVDVLGFSLGGLVAQEIVRRHGGRVRRLVLASTTFGLGGIPPAPMVQRALWSTTRFRSAEHAAEAMRTLVGGRTAADPEALASVLNARADTAPTVRGYYYQFFSTLWWSSIPWLHTLEVPCLVLHGASDPLVAVENARILAWRLPNSQLLIVPGAGHLLLFDQSADVAGPILRFLES